MDTALPYKIKVYDTEIARFLFARTMSGFRACGLETDQSKGHLLPLNIAAAPNDVELSRFLESRRIPKGRVYLEEILRPFGLVPNDTKGIIDLSRGTSVNDPYSIVPEQDDVPYAEYNLFDNDFDEVLQVVSYTGVLPEGALGGGRPSDLTPSGAFPKTWRRVGGELVLYKAGSPVAAPNYGKEPVSEFLSWGVANAAGLQAVPYGLTEWRGRLCSTCPLFNTPDVAFVPFELCLPADAVRLGGFQDVLQYFEKIGQDAAQKFKSMAVFDSVIANPDRHPGNFGVLRDMRTGEVLDAAPIFDNNVALFARDYDEQLELDGMMERFSWMPGVLDAQLPWQGDAMLGDEQRVQVERLTDFRFEADGFLASYRENNPGARDAVADARLEALSRFVQARAQELIERGR